MAGDQAAAAVLEQEEEEEWEDRAGRVVSHSSRRRYSCVEASEWVRTECAFLPRGIRRKRKRKKHCACVRVCVCVCVVHVVTYREEKLSIASYQYDILRRKKCRRHENGLDV